MSTASESTGINQPCRHSRGHRPHHRQGCELMEGTLYLAKLRWA